MAKESHGTSKILANRLLNHYLQRYIYFIRGSWDPSYILGSFVLVILQLKLIGKRGVYKDTRLQIEGAKIFEKDGIIFNCTFSLCDLGRSVNEYVIS